MTLHEHMLEMEAEDRDGDAVSVIVRVREGSGADREDYLNAQAWLGLSEPEKLMAIVGGRAA